MLRVSCALALAIASTVYSAEPVASPERPTLSGSVWVLNDSYISGRSEPGAEGSLLVIGKDSLFLLRDPDSKSQDAPYSGKIKILAWRFGDGVQELDTSCVTPGGATVFGKFDLAVSDGLLTLGMDPGKSLEECVRPGLDREKAPQWSELSKVDAQTAIDRIERLRADGRSIPEADEILAGLKTAE